MDRESTKLELLEICRKNGGILTDIDILFYFGQDGKDGMSEDTFLDMFKSLKTKIKGRKDMTRKLTDQAKKNLKKLIQKGYDYSDLEKAINGMYYGENNNVSWAERTGNDTPTHLLREGVFERYLNLIENNNGSKKTAGEMAAEVLERRSAQRV